MTTELPCEIWLHILSFLDSKTIRQLCFVNTLFYNLSLDNCHRIIQLGYPTFTPNAPFRDPGNARRARVLLIRSGPIYYEPLRRSRRPIWKSIKAKFNRIRRHDISHEREKMLDQLLHAVPGLTSLITLDVCLPYSLDDHSFYWTKLDALKAGWPIFAANLTTLTIDVPLEEIHLVLLPHISLVRLEKFSAMLHVAHKTSQPNNLLRKSLSPFLIAHSPTLRSLKLDAQEKVDISSVLADLRHMPCLNTLNLSHRFLSLELTSLAGHHQFLETHRSQLQHLRLDYFEWGFPFFNTPEEFFNQEWCRVLFPELRSLSLRLRVSYFTTPFEDAAITYIQQHIPTVESLHVYLTFSYEQVASILTGPKGGEYQLTKLGTLDLRIWCFSPALLILLAVNAPQLQSLRLRPIVLGPDNHTEPFGENRAPEFCNALQSSRFPEWGLYDMTILPLRRDSLNDSLLNQCNVALFCALPKLKKIYGLGLTERRGTPMTSLVL